ncbi:MAG: ATP synthase F0 subunit B [Bdellovibrionales bacterium]|nr:ATP synthase F0 subunit B [Bdellovibrionales bacterium]
MIYLVVSLLFSAQAFAAGGGGHISELVYPSINFIIFFGFLVWKIKKPLSEMFTTKANEVEEFYKFAEQKNKDAEKKYEEFEEKLKNISKELDLIKSEAQKEEDLYTKQVNDEKDKTLERIQRETQARLESEKNAMIKDLETDLIKKIISRTREQIGGSSDLKSKVTNNLISGIQ